MTFTEGPNPGARDRVRAYLLEHPDAKNRDITEACACSIRLVSNIKTEMVKEGLIPPSGRGRRGKRKPIDWKAKMAKDPAYARTIPHNFNNRKKFVPPDPDALLIPSDLMDLDLGDISLEDLENDEKTRNRILKEVQQMAFSPGMSPDTRMSAMQLWVKIKDIVRSKDIGPGPPRTKVEIIERLVRLFKGVGPELVLKSIEIAFKKDSDEKTENVEKTTPTGTSEAPNPA